MSVNIHAHWEGVAAQRAALPPGDEFYIISIESPDHSKHRPGVVCGASRETTAIRLKERTHRLATKAEIAAHHADVQKRTAELASEEVKKRQQFALPKELNDLVIALVANTSQPQPQPDSQEEPEPKKKRGE
jgi:hypothetical protein